MFHRLMVLVSLAMTLFTASAAHAERRVALVIGNSAYSSAASLRNPRNDATDMAETLKKLGFEVELGLDLDQKSFAATIRAGLLRPAVRSRAAAADRARRPAGHAAGTEMIVRRETLCRAVTKTTPVNRGVRAPD